MILYPYSFVCILAPLRLWSHAVKHGMIRFLGFSGSIIQLIGGFPCRHGGTPLSLDGLWMVNGAPMALWKPPNLGY